MASPESNKPAPKSPPVQDSPVFGYVSSLSPIKPVNARSTVQVYENIDVPSPQLVFKTPNFIRPRYSSLSERSQHLASSGTENLFPGYVNNTREFSDNMITGTSLSLSTSQLISYSDNECANIDPSPNQSCTSPTNCVDAFLADLLENSENSSSSPEFCVKRVAKDKEGDKSGHSDNKMEGLKKVLQVHPRTSAIPVKEQTNDRLHSKRDAFPPHTSQNDSICIEESTVEPHVANMKEQTRRTAVISLRAPYQTEEDSGSVSLTAEAMKINKGSITEQLGQVSKNENDSVYERVMDCSIVSSVKDFDISHNEKENYSTSDILCHRKQDLKQQTAKTDQSVELDCTLKLHPGSPQDIQTGDNFIDSSLQMPSVSTGNNISFDPEDDALYKRGKRKRLQFEATENLRISNRNSFNCATEASNADLSITLLGVETANASHAESITKSSHKQVGKSVPASASSGFSVKFDRSGRCKENLVAAPRPAGIGLHLNSIGGAASNNCNSNVQLERNSSVQEDKALAEDIDQLSEKSRNCPVSMSLIDPTKLTFSSDKPLNYVANENNVEKQLGNQAFQQHSSGSYQSPLSVKPLKSLAPLKHMDRYMTPCSTKMLSSEVANKSEESTQTSPKKKKKTPENDGKKRCNCKRSKCLKLYCDCFAAGSFCSEACACLECSNKVECEETVRETRQQIESRNPLAFAPKVILRVSDPPKASGDNKTITPASARHKRGCNCKRSLCLKKYCECFQAGVGCSLGCRCEGCKNTFGTKDGCEISEVVVQHKRPEEGGWERDLSSELECIEVNRQITITEQCRYRLSPLTPLLQSSMGNDVTKPQFRASYFPSPESVASAVQSYDSSAVDLNAMQNSGLAEDRTGSLSPVLYDPKSEFHNAGKGDPFTPGWEGFPDICNLSPLPKASPNAGGSSSASKSGERKIVKLHRGSNRIALGGLRWRRSPITPLPQFGEGKFQREPDSDSKLQCNPEDDTPEILKETRSPIKSVTATSPNQKRVSPPHQAGTSVHSPSSLRSGRRYILQSMPTFPPLTPYSKINRENET